MEYKNKDFNFKNALETIQEEQPLLGKEGILTPLIKQLTEREKGEEKRSLLLAGLIRLQELQKLQEFHRRHTRIVKHRKPSLKSSLHGEKNDCTQALDLLVMAYLEKLFWLTKAMKPWGTCAERSVLETVEPTCLV